MKPTSNHTDATARPWAAMRIGNDINIGVANNSPADTRSRIKLWIAMLPLVKFDGAASSIIDAGGSAAEQESNAALIVAAVNTYNPERLEALEKVVEVAAMLKSAREVVQHRVKLAQDSMSAAVEAERLQGELFKALSALTPKA